VDAHVQYMYSSSFNRLLYLAYVDYYWKCGCRSKGDYARTWTQYVMYVYVGVVGHQASAK